MKRIWRLFVDSLGDILRLLRHGRRMTATVGQDDDSPEEPAWDRCESLLDCVLVPTDEYVFLKGHILGGQRCFAEGDNAAAAYEVSLALRRACKLRRLYG
jgi:hypothetical protein